jgi:hypothetical protein
MFENRLEEYKAKSQAVVSKLQKDLQEEQQKHTTCKVCVHVCMYGWNDCEACVHVSLFVCMHVCMDRWMTCKACVRVSLYV